MAETIEFDASGYDLVRRYAVALREIKHWSATRDEAREQLVKWIGDAEAAAFEGHEVLTVNRTRPRRFDKGAFAGDHPDLHEAYLARAEHDEIRLYPHLLPRDEVR